MRTSPLPVALGLLLAAPATAGPTEVLINPDQSGAPYTARYSQAVPLRARLVDDSGNGVAGRRVSFFLRHGDDDVSEFLVADPVTDAEGYADARLTLVNGRHGGQTFVAAAPTQDVAGERYVVRAAFTGDPDAAGCDLDAGPAPGDAGLVDGGAPAPLCASQSEGELFVALETTTLVIEPGNEVILGDSIDLIATLTDANGDAPQAGTDVNGSEPVPLAGRSVSFFYDADGNGRPSAGERLGSADTNDQGIAVFPFLADPSFVRAQNEEAGIHAQFGGDEQYQLSGAQQSLVVTPGAADPARTLLEVTPEELLADGFSLVEVRATLVDPYNNLLGPDDDLYNVSFTTDLGTLEGAAERDPLSGQYVQQLKAPRAGGTATVQVTVDGVPGPSKEVRFLERGCSCQGAGDSAPLSLLALSLLALGARRKRSPRG